MGNVCSCFGKKKRNKNYQPHDSAFSKNSQPKSKTHRVFQTQANTGTQTNLTVNMKIQPIIFKDKPEVDKYIEQTRQKPMPTSTQSYIRKRINTEVSQNKQEDEKLQNLNKARKIISTIHNSDKAISIKSCKRSSIFIFDDSNSIQIEKCFDTIVFCAPCSGKITINNCKEVKLILISSEIEISLFCQTPPKIINSSQICFSNFLRIGYCQMAEHFSACNLSVWNNRFLQVSDSNQNPQQQHYSLKTIHEFDLEWQTILRQGCIQPADPIIPMLHLNIKKKKKTFLMNQPMRQIEQKLLKYIISNEINIHKSFKGSINQKTFEKIRKIFPSHEQNIYLCLIIGKELETSGFEAYFDIVQDEEIQKQIFPGE